LWSKYGFDILTGLLDLLDALFSKNYQRLCTNALLLGRTRRVSLVNDNSSAVSLDLGDNVAREQAVSQKAYPSCE
jgi:hypothetical protein